MLRIPLADLEHRDNRKDLVSALRSGQTMIYPTDTLYGLGGRADLDTVCRAVDHLKARPQGQIYSAALSSVTMLSTMVTCPDPRERALLDAILPGPYTIVFRLKDGCRIPANRYQETLGVRIPQFPILLELIEELGFPLITTSVNRSGEAPLTDPETIAGEFPSVDLLLDAGVLARRSPSTLLDISRGQPYPILRRGAGLEKLFASMEKLNLSWSIPADTVP